MANLQISSPDVTCPHILSADGGFTSHSLAIIALRVSHFPFWAVNALEARRAVSFPTLRLALGQLSLSEPLRRVWTGFLLFLAWISSISALAGQKEELNLHPSGWRKLETSFLSLQQGAARPWITSPHLPGPQLSHLSDGIIIATPYPHPEGPPGRVPA